MAKSLTSLNIKGKLTVLDKEVALKEDLLSLATSEALQGVKSTAEENASNIATLNTTVGTKANASDLEATNTEVAKKADASDLEATNTEVAKKADAETVNSALEGKANVSDLEATNTEVAKKADTETVNTALAAKADASALEATQGEVDALEGVVATKADAETVNTALAAKADTETVNTALASKADASALEAAQGEIDALEGVVATKADASALEPLATKEGVTAEIAAAIAGVTQFGYSIVEQLPETGEAGVIYLVAETTGGETNLYKEYIWVGDKFERFGPELDLSGYQTDEEAQAAVNAINQSIATKADASALEATQGEVDALEGVVATKADTEAVNTALAAKADTETVNTALAAKADVSALEATQGEVDALEGVVATKADTETVNTALAAKADTETVNTALAAKADASALEATQGEVDALEGVVATKADAETVNTALAAKADASKVYTKEEVDSAIANAKPNHQHFEFETEDARKACTTMQDGDTAVVRSIIKASSGTEGEEGYVPAIISYTAYVYDNNAWKAMDGNYNADDVYLDSDIVLAGSYTAVGNITKASTTSTATYASKGMSISQFLENMLSQDTQPKIASNPAVTVTLTKGGSNVTADSNVEVGTTVELGWSASLSAGSYTNFANQVATGITASGWDVELQKGSNTVEEASTSSGTFGSVVLDDGDVYKIKATATYEAGAVAKTALGNVSNPEVKIAAGSKNNTTKKITAYRKSFWGTKTAKSTVDGLTSDYVRSLANSSTSALADGSTMSISIPVGAMTVVFAYPKSLGEAKSVVDAATKYDVLSAFTANGAQTVSVASASGSDSIDYYVYFTNFANAVDAANTYTVTI